MRLRIILHYLGMVIAILGLFMFIPLVTSLIYGEGDTSAFAVSAGISLSVGFLLWRFNKLEEKKLGVRESFVLVVSGWLVAAIFGALPYAISGALPSFLDCFFEAMSGYTTTGATVFTSIEIRKAWIIFIIIVFLLLWLPKKGLFLLSQINERRQRIPPG